MKYGSDFGFEQTFQVKIKLQLQTVIAGVFWIISQSVMPLHLSIFSTYLFRKAWIVGMFTKSHLSVHLLACIISFNIFWTNDHDLILYREVVDDSSFLPCCSLLF